MRTVNVWTIIHILILTMICSCSFGHYGGRNKSREQLKEEREKYKEQRIQFNHLVLDVYEGCGFIKACVKVCSDEQTGCSTCIANHNCFAIITMEHKNDQYHFKMFRALTENLEYISFGISLDSLMGSDFVLACVASGTDTHITNHFAAYATPANKRLEYAGVPQNLYSVPRHTVLENHHLCEFTMKKKFKFYDIDVDLDNDEYSLLGAIGEASSPFELAGHSRSTSGRVSTERFLWRNVPEYPDYDEGYDKASPTQIASHFLVGILTLVLLTLN